jgi:hypothetical protein
MLLEQKLRRNNLLDANGNLNLDDNPSLKGGFLIIPNYLLDCIKIANKVQNSKYFIPLFIYIYSISLRSNKRSRCFKYDRRKFMENLFLDKNSFNCVMGTKNKNDNRPYKLMFKWNILIDRGNFIEINQFPDTWQVEKYQDKINKLINDIFNLLNISDMEDYRNRNQNND